MPIPSSCRETQKRPLSQNVRSSFRSVWKKIASCFKYPKSTTPQLPILHLLPKDFLAFDIGANIGNYAAACLAAKARLILCAEPHPRIRKKLQNRFHREPKILVVPYILADQCSSLPFYPYYDGTLSTASTQWMEGRFQKEHWAPPILLPSITLDILIAQYGTPDFCKIDVEGFELQVLHGLTKQIPLLSIEFTKEFLKIHAFPCIAYLIHLGYSQFNVCVADNAFLQFSSWLSHEEIQNYLSEYPDPLLWGDIYAKL